MNENAKRPVLVTGSSKGIGKGVALRLAAMGFPVTVHYGGDRAGAEATAKEITDAGGKADVIGFDVRDELFGNLDPLGRDLIIGDARYLVVGLVAEQGQVLGQNQDDQVWIPMDSFRRAYGRRNSIDMFVKARGGVPGVEASVDEVRAVLRALRHTPFRDEDPFGIVTVENAKVEFDGDDKASVSFRQLYKSDIVARSETSKTLVLVRADGRWKIQQEIAGR